MLFYTSVEKALGAIYTNQAEIQGIADSGCNNKKKRRWKLMAEAG